MRQREALNQQIIRALQREYEAKEDVPLKVVLVGNMSSDNMARVASMLLDADLSNKPVGYGIVIDTDNGLRAHVHRGYRSEWLLANDRAGFVDLKPMPRILEAIEKKSKELPRYMQAVGPDVRLLLVADRIFNSGKVALQEKTNLDRRGFQVVYFLSYPESVTVF